METSATLKRRLQALGLAIVAVAMGLASYFTGGSKAVPNELWGNSLDAGLTRAAQENSLVLLEFSASWCPPCRAMEQTTFQDEQVRQAMAAFVPVKLDVDANASLARKYLVESIPTTLLLKADGTELSRHVGYIEAERYTAILEGAQRAHSVS